MSLFSLTVPVADAVAKTIVNIFETGRMLGDYGRVTLIPGDTGGLTYGRSQATLASGSLYRIVAAYADRDDARLGAALSSYLPALSRRDGALNTDETLADLLREAGRDPVMVNVQDAVFDAHYWSPAMDAAGAMRLDDPLSRAVVYDSYIHGAWGLCRDRTNANRGSVRSLGARGWTAAYVATRRDWLARHRNAVLHKTVYRMDGFQTLISDEAWDLAPPLAVRGVPIEPAAVDPEAAPRTLVAERPWPQGYDVRAVQRALVSAGRSLPVDGVFGPGTADHVRAVQGALGLAADGVVGPDTRSALGLDEQGVQKAIA